MQKNEGNFKFTESIPLYPWWKFRILKLRALRFLEMSRTKHTVTQNPEERKPLQNNA
jgi:hypothetical protein